MFEDKKEKRRKLGEFGWRIVLAQLWFHICHRFVRFKFSAKKETKIDVSLALNLGGAIVE